MLKEKRGWDTDDNWEESPTIDTLAGGLSERGLAILREGMSGTPKPAPPSNPIPGSPPAEPAYHVSPTQQHEDDEYYGGEGYDPETPSSPELERFERDEMEDTFANIALNDRISGGRISMHRGAAAGLEYIDEEDEEEMEEPQEQTRQ